MAESGTPDPAGVFQELFATNLSTLIGKNFTNVTSGLFGKDIITSQEISRIKTTPNLNDEDRGSEVAFLLYDKIKHSAEDPVQCLLKICGVFKSDLVNDASLKKHGESMESKFKNDASALSETPHVLQQMKAELTATPGVNKDVALKVLSNNNEMIKESSIGLMYLADKMVVNGIITDKEKSTIVSDRMTGLSKDERMEELLKELKKAVKQNGAIFMWFIKILKDYDTVVSKAVAENLMKQYTELLKTAA